MNDGRAYIALIRNTGPGHTGITLTWRIRAVTGGRILHVTGTGHRSGARYGRGANTRRSRPYVPGRVPAETRYPAARSLPYPGNPDIRSTTGRLRASSKSAKRRISRVISAP